MIDAPVAPSVPVIATTPVAAPAPDTTAATEQSLRGPQRLLRAFNDQATAECVGFVADGALLVLLDIVGHKNACKSLWATGVGGARRPFGISGGVSVSGGEAKVNRYHAFWAELPEQSAHNLVICHERVLVATTDPKHIRPFYLMQNDGMENVGAQSSENDPPAALLQRFAAMLNQALDLPVLPQWAGALWMVGLRSGLIEPITAGGDIAAAFKLLPHAEPWGEIIRDAFETGDIQMPEAQTNRR